MTREEVIAQAVEHKNHVGLYVDSLGVVYCFARTHGGASPVVVDLPALLAAGREYAAETERARAKFGDQFDFTDGNWLAVLVEEVGEAATEALRAQFMDRDALFRRSLETGIDLGPDDDPLIRLDRELVQVAAVAMRWRAALAARLRSEDPTE